MKIFKLYLKRIGVAGYREILREMAEDKVHGASWYFARAIDLVEEAQAEGIPAEAVSKDLLGVRPGMASLANVADLVGRAYGPGLVRVLRDYWLRARGLVKESFSRLTWLRNVVTISYSSNVADLASSLNIRVIPLESRPGDEAFEWVKIGFRPVPDLAMAVFVRDADAVVMGCDGMYVDGILNKVGSLPLALTAKYLNKPVVVVSESFKAIDSPTPPSLFTVNYNGVEVPLFEQVPYSLIDVVVTDVGVFERPTGEAASTISREFRRRVLEALGKFK